MEPCTIIFDNPDNTYFVGQTVNGRVEFTLSKQEKIRGIILQVKGEGNVSWKGKEVTEVTKEGSKPKTKSVTFTGREKYFRLEHYCMGSKENEGSILTTGKHVYPFSFILPGNLPSSFEGKYGYVRYTVKIILDRPEKWNYEIKTAFTVISLHVLGLHPNLQQQVKVSSEKYFGWMCCSSGPLVYGLTVPQTGFVPGESLLFDVKIDNFSKIVVNGVTLKLQQFISYRSQNPSESTKQEQLILQKLKLGSVPARKSVSWIEPLIIPVSPPSNLQHCSIITMEYHLLLELTVSCQMFSKLKLSIPLTIGTVALNRRSSISKEDLEPSAPPDYEEATSGINKSVIPDIEASSLCVYPFYSTKSIRDDEDNEHTMYCDDSKEFSPHYLLYNFNMA